MSAGPRLLEVRKNVLKQNDVIARALRERFRAEGTFVVSLVSSPGAGKTAFLEKILSRLRTKYRVAALVGDLATENDSVRLARSEAPVKQITTGTLCHLEAEMVERIQQAVVSYYGQFESEAAEAEPIELASEPAEPLAEVAAAETEAGGAETPGNQAEETQEQSVTMETEKP